MAGVGGARASGVAWYKTKSPLRALAALMYVEEAQMRIDVRLYDRFYVSLQHVPRQPQEFVSITVPGVGERKPALQVGNV